MQASFTEKRQAAAAIALVESRHSTTPSVQSTQNNVSYNLGHIGAGTAIAAAASQAIAATQQVNNFSAPFLNIV